MQQRSFKEGKKKHSIHCELCGKAWQVRSDEYNNSFQRKKVDQRTTY